MKTTRTTTKQGRSLDLQLKPLSALVLSVIGMYAHAENAAADSAASERTTLAAVEFEGGFLMNGGHGGIDVSRFEQANPVLPGTYTVDVYVNQDRVGRVDVPFASVSARTNAQPIFDKALLQRIGIDFGKLSPEVSAKLAEGQSGLLIGDAIESATTTFEFGDQRLDLSIPQAALSRSARGYVSPEFWDSGVNVGMLGYNFNLYHSKVSGLGNSSTQGYLGLNGGVNVGDWHFRHDGSYTFDSQGNRKYQDIATYAQRDLTSLSSQLTIGETYTSGELFDSTPFRGVRVASDDRMLPESLQGYAPTVRGIANTNARVTIRQSNVIIYETTVAPGAFEITDLYATGYGGDLQVSVQESDGSTHSFSVPYAAVPLSLRPGVNRFSAVGGTVRDQQLSKNPVFVQGTWQRGFTNLFTGYAGVTAAQGYASGLVGGAFNTEIGAIGLDITQSTLSLGGGHLTGSSVRASYAKNLPATGTNIAVAAYRYSTGGFFGLNEAMTARYADGAQASAGNMTRTRNRASITLSQQLGERRGQINITGSTADYWNRGGTDLNYAVAYANTYKNIGYNLSVMRQRNALGKMDTVFYAGVSIPLGKTNPVSVAANFSRDTDGRSQAQTTLSGAIGTDKNLSYGVTANHASGGVGNNVTSGSANMLYRAPVGELSGSIGGGTGYSQGSIGVRGAVVAHPGGITLSQPLSETFGIVEAPDAESARVLSASGVRVNSQGYAVVPYLTPYRMNSVELDPKGLSTDVELQVTSQQVAPRAGSAVLLKYATVSGRSAVLEVEQANGQPLPFGATVVDAEGKEVGVVAQASRIFARGLQEQGALSVKWGDGHAERCDIDYTLPARGKGYKADTYQQVQTRCKAPMVSSTFDKADRS